MNMQTNGLGERRLLGIDPDKLYSTSEMADITGMSAAAYEAWRLRADPAGPPFVRLGRAVRYVGSDVIAWLSNNRVSRAG